MYILLYKFIYINFFKGNINEEWVEELPECELGTGTAFGVQTCFQNRFGHETGSDEFGAHLFLHMVSYARIQYCEFNFVGQAFNLGRYPIHFHTTGDVQGTDTYIRGNSIHRAFNRALTMHGIHNLTVEYNVAFNVKGRDRKNRNITKRISFNLKWL